MNLNNMQKNSRIYSNRRNKVIMLIIINNLMQGSMTKMMKIVIMLNFKIIRKNNIIQKTTRFLISSRTPIIDNNSLIK